MPIITFIGGGSAKFVAALVRDLFTFAELRDSSIRLMDIAPDRLDRSRRLVQRIIDELDLPATVEAYDEQRPAVTGADYVISSATGRQRARSTRPNTTPGSARMSRPPSRSTPPRPCGATPSTGSTTSAVTARSRSRSPAPARSTTRAATSTGPG